MFEKKNVIAVMFDTLQFNYLGCYGNKIVKTPNIDRFASEGVLFENAYTEGLPTVPCRRAMLTGRYTLPVKGWSPLDIDDTTIADLCWGRPIDTYLITDTGPFRQPKFGYTRGFDKVYFIHGHEVDQSYYAQDELPGNISVKDFYEDHVIEKADEIIGGKIMDTLLEEAECYLKKTQYWRSDEDQQVAQVIKRSMTFLDEIDRTKSFFMWIDSYDPHEPWDAPSVYDPEMNCPYDPDYEGKEMFLPIQSDVKGLYTERELQHIRALFAEKITMCDKWFGVLLRHIHKLGLEDNTLIMMFADHGTPMGNGKDGHGIVRKCRPWPYEELAHIPFIMRGPGLMRNKRLDGFVQSCDVAPTVCEWLGIDIHPSMQGKSLLGMARGEVDSVREFAIAGYYKFSWSIITKDWSYIHWLKSTNISITEARYGIYASEMDDAIAHLREMDEEARKQGKSNNLTSALGAPSQKDFVGSAEEKQKNAATLDGEDQWSCTPAGKSDMPDTDQLFNRHTDKFQLDNIIDEHPEVAKMLLEQLKEFIEFIKRT